MSSSQIALSWTAVPGATQYQVCRGSTSAGLTSGTSFTDTGLTANTQYTYTVTAFDASANTSYASQPVVVTTLAPAPAVTCNKNPLTWYTTNDFTFTATGGFGAGTSPTTDTSGMSPLPTRGRD